jgi:hypothetical protein
MTNTIENISASLLRSSVDQLIEDFLYKQDAVVVSEELNSLLASYFTHQDRKMYEYEAEKTGDSVYTITSTISFLLKLNSYWAQYQSALSQ